MSERNGTPAPRRSRGRSAPAAEDVVGRPRVYTVGQVARMLGAGTATVARYFDSGRLSGWCVSGRRTKGKGDRRITHESLLRFLSVEGVPPGCVGLSCPSVLLATPDDALALALAAPLADCGLALERPATWYALGRRLGVCLPAAVVLDPAAGRAEALAVCVECPHLAVLLGAEDREGEAAPAGCELVPWPWTAARVAGAVARRERERRG